MKLSSDLNQTMARFHQLLDVQTNFDIVYHTLTIGGKQALIYFVDGLTKDEVLLRIVQGFASIQPDDMPDSPHGFSKKYVPYGETGLEDEESQILVSLLSGLSCLLIDGYDKCITIDCRTYPARGVEEPEKDKVLRGSRDGFVAVSYTHLDVYKRQSSAWPSQTSGSRPPQPHLRIPPFRPWGSSPRRRQRQKAPLSGHFLRFQLGSRYYQYNPCLLYTSRCV